MEQFTQEMLKRLDALAGKLGMAATALWGFYLRQARITGSVELVCLGLCVLAAFFANRWRSIWWQKHLDDKYEDWEIGSCLMGLLIIVFGGLGIMFFYFGLTALFNPGYWAFQTIVEQLKGSNPDFPLSGK